jgi:hypothetical protein
VATSFWSKVRNQPLKLDDPQFEEKLKAFRWKMAFYVVALIGLGIWMLLDVSKLKGILALAVALIPAVFCLGARRLVELGARQKARKAANT